MADRHCISNRKVFGVVAAVISSSPTNNVNDFVISPSTVSRNRAKLRTELALNIKTDFHLSATNHCIVHWDGKIVEEFFHNKTDRIAVIITDSECSEKKEKLLAINKVDSSTGVNQANVVLDALCDWKLQNNIVGMCFDTTASNTGIHSGAAVILERGLEEKSIVVSMQAPHF